MSGEDRTHDDVQGHIVPTHPIVSAELGRQRGQELRDAADQRQQAAQATPAAQAEPAPTAQRRGITAQLSALFRRVRRATV